MFPCEKIDGSNLYADRINVNWQAHGPTGFSCPTVARGLGTPVVWSVPAERQIPLCYCSECCRADKEKLDGGGRHALARSQDKISINF